MKKINLPTFTIFILSLSLSVKAQWLSQKLVAPTGGSVKLFGENARFLDNNTLLVCEPDWKSIKNNDTIIGAVFIYKKNGPSWVLSQTISSGNNSDFAFSFAQNNNTLAISAPNEEVSGLKGAGALYFYKRADSTSDFVFYKKLTNPDPIANGHFGALNYFNDQYMVINGKVYKLENQGIKAIKNAKYADLPWYISPWISTITENGYFISIGEGTGIFKIDGDSLILINELFRPDVGKGGYFGNHIIDGNTVGSSLYGPDGTTYELAVINNDGNFGRGNWMNANPYINFYGNDGGAGSLSLKEKKWLFSDFSKGIIAYKYHTNQYFKAGVIKTPVDYKSKKTPFGYNMTCSENILLVHDPEDSTNRTSPGSLHLMVLGDYLTDSLGGIKTKYPFKDANDNFATGVAIDSNLAVIGAVDNDIEDSCGTAFIYRKVNGKWQFVSKIAPPNLYVYSRDEIGHSVQISDNYILVGAPRGLDPGNSLQNGTVFAISKDPDPDYGYTNKQLISPQEPNWADTSGLSDGSNVYEEKFGYSIAADSVFTAISAPIRSHYKGEVYIYKQKDTDDFAYLQKIAPTNLANNSEFGHSLTLKGKYLVAGAPGKSSTNGTYFYQLQGDSFVFKQRFEGPFSAKPANSVALNEQYAFAAPGKGNFVQVYSLFGSVWSEVGKIVPFQDSASIEVAADNNVLLVSSNNENGKAVVVRYELFGNKWLKTGIQTLGEATGSPVKLCIKGNQSVAAYKNDIKSNESYALFGVTSDFITSSGTVTSTEITRKITSEGILSPNPFTSGDISVHHDNARYAEIISIESGVVTKSLTVKDGKISPSNMIPGMYLVKVYTADGLVNEKLIVK